MVNSKISLSKIIKLWLPIFFWSVSLTIIFSILGPKALSGKTIIKSIFPILFNQYWFMTVYFFMYCMIPLLNLIVRNLDTKNKKIYFFILGTLITISQLPWFYGGNKGFVGSSLLVFCFIYCVGALLRKENLLENITFVKKVKITTLILVVVDIFLITVLTFVAGKTQLTRYLGWAQLLSFNYSSLFPIILAFGTFILIGTSHVGYHPLWNKVAGVTFGIYLISDNNSVRDIIWKNIFSMNNVLAQNVGWIILYPIIVSLIVFIVSGCLEYLRKLIFNKFENNICTYISKVVKISFS
ncbi:acyltransferase [Lactobacillus crispatus]|uniref:acyltransferase family protein n=1 Tax=Lactobacillus crispatus TaxID=47770 RepID=UPI0015ECC2F9|nr:acyltransferase family protein [Lactobacillus crispatus]MBA2915952.1 acyltransferase [Lactobacillus crispatus]